MDCQFRIDFELIGNERFFRMDRGTVAIGDIYEAFGRAAEAAQHYEYGLATIRLYLEYFGKGWWEKNPDPMEVETLMESFDRKTLGALLGQLRKLSRFENGSIDFDQLNVAVDARNFLMHEFFLRHPERMKTQKGLQIKLAELSEHQNTLDNAVNIGSVIMTSLVGLRADLDDPDRKQAIIEEGFENLAAQSTAGTSGKPN